MMKNINNDFRLQIPCNVTDLGMGRVHPLHFETCIVNELKRFATWGILFKNEMWLLLGGFIAASKGDRIHTQSSVSQQEGLAIA